MTNDALYNDWPQSCVIDLGVPPSINIFFDNFSHSLTLTLWLALDLYRPFNTLTVLLKFLDVSGFSVPHS